ncbi:hypothetical protein N7517_001481 [Penicillium concentricum]|uniref:Uncharacterized protein n=1 Tax=Penicillium concentricum TaxID=293559 RepID=A0A9W9SS40_9EURO|nr:uncharacterized protein N7517_001481 [Penicillium concentricum]KAJ5383570.1 hypothetical protein N7517_001481 [Penicillium concentricum]
MATSKINGQSVFAISHTFVCSVFEENLDIVDPTKERGLHQGSPSTYANGIYRSPVLNEKRYHRQALLSCCHDKGCSIIVISSDKQLGFARILQVFPYRFDIPGDTVADWHENSFLFKGLNVAPYIDGDDLL